MPFTFEPLEIPEVFLITPKVFNDERGFFEETYKQSVFRDFGIFDVFVQDNHSFSQKNTLRGLHFQSSPHAQGKLVRCAQGKILDVAVDLRMGSPTFRKWVSVELSGENHRMLWIPEGFAHGFMAIQDSHVEYKVTSEYASNSEDGIIWNDSELNISWGIDKPLVSEKDCKWPIFDESKVYFKYNYRDDDL